jgi:hypothetical protein
LIDQEKALGWEWRRGKGDDGVAHTVSARLFIAVALLAACSAGCTGVASAAGLPPISATWVEAVTATSAGLRAEINPNESPTKYLFEYLTDAEFQANKAAARPDFFGAAKKPMSPTGIGSGTTSFLASQAVEALTPVTIYHYRAVAENSFGKTLGPARALTTEVPTNVIPPLDNRGWEMVSPVDKNGGSIQGFGQSFGGGVFQAAAAGGALTYSSVASFGPDPQGAPAASQYLAGRGAGGWSVQNITTPLLSGSYGDHPEGAPYQLFSSDLSRGLLLNGRRCRGGDGECPVANPPLPGSGAPPGYENYYLRDSGTAGFDALLKSGDIAGLTRGPAQFELNFAGATPGLTHLVLSSCAALTAGATEVAAAGGCDPDFQNLYAWDGSGLSLVNSVPVALGEPEGAALAAQSGAISSDGSRVYWTVNGDLYLRDGAQTEQVDEAQGGGGTFETASANGSVAFFTKGGHLFRYLAATHTATDLTPGGGVLGVLGAAADGSRLYYQGTAGLELWHEGATTEVAPGSAAAASANYPPATGTARVAPDGAHIAFLSSAELTEYENFGFQEVFLYGPPPGGGAATLTCVSCNPTGERPNGAASIPGAIANGTGPSATDLYKPRALSGSGSRVFFDSSDVLANQDSNHRPDVYEWEAKGVGSCDLPSNCVGLVSSGRSPEPSSFIDASADGTDVFFLTESSLVPQDPGSYDLYDFRENGGFPPPVTAIPCNGDACQSLPAAPEDPTPGTLVPNGGNPPLRFPKQHHKRHHKKKHHRKHGHKKGHHRHGGGG